MNVLRTDVDGPAVREISSRDAAELYFHLPSGTGRAIQEPAERISEYGVGRTK